MNHSIVLHLAEVYAAYTHSGTYVDLVLVCVCVYAATRRNMLLLALVVQAAVAHESVLRMLVPFASRWDVMNLAGGSTAIATSLAIGCSRHELLGTVLGVVITALLK